MDQDVPAEEAAPTRARRGARGSYAKGQAKRREIVEAALVVFGRSGFHSGSLQEIAKHRTQASALVDKVGVDR